MRKKVNEDEGDTEIEIDEDEIQKLLLTQRQKMVQLYSDDTHFVFYSKSADKKPGMGAGEKNSRWRC